MVANGLARRSGDRRGGKAFCSVVPSSSMFAESGEAESESEREATQASERVRRGVAWGGEKRDRQITRARRTDGRTDGRTAIPLLRSLAPRCLSTPRGASRLFVRVGKDRAENTLNVLRRRRETASPRWGGSPAAAGRVR